MPLDQVSLSGDSHNVPAPASLRPCRTFHNPAFDQFDEILHLVE
jgi:hypothetical protein